MIPVGSLFILDTNVIVHLIRQNEVGRRIESELALRARNDRPLISIVTVGECLELARRFAWGSTKTERLHALLREMVVIEISRAGIPDRFAAIADHCRRSGRALSDNDLWIAASASVAGARLVTTDRDFDPLDPEFLSRIWINPRAEQ